MNYAAINEDLAKKLREAHGDPLVINDREHTARQQYELAAETLEQFLPNDPHDTALRYNLAVAWLKAGDKEKARRHAEEALRLNERLTYPSRKLTDPQRKQLLQWIPKPSSS
jgi:Flp pilus assembly protein TadD